MKEEKDSVFKNYKELFKEALNDLKTKGRRHRQIPNILTLLRLTAPFFIIPAAFTGNIPLAAGLTAGFGLTDFIDGFIARKFNLTSELGKDLDAVCDKVFAGTLLIAASFANPVLLCNLALEAVIAGINIYKTLKGENVHSTYVGKIKTWALFGLAGLGLITPLLNINTPLNILMGITTAMQGLTICSYIHKDDNNKPNSNSDEKEDIPTLKEGSKETTEQQEKTKVLEKENKNQKDDNLVELRELQSVRDYLLSKKEQSKKLSPEDIKIIQKRMDLKKVLGGTK